MMLCVRRFILALIMLGLPLQGALAAITPLCAQAKSMAARQGIQTEHGVSSTACNQHDTASHDHSGSNISIPDEANFALSCDGVVCHISGTALPPTASALNLAAKFSYPILFNPHFTSSILKQLQRPPLA